MADDLTSTLTIRLFGTLEVVLNGSPLSGLHVREGARLLSYLALHYNRPVSYRTLAELFWPAEARQHAGSEGGEYHNTRQAIYNLRRLLGAEAVRLQRPAKGVVCLNLTDADVDVVAFEDLSRSQAPETWRRALALYRAPLLENWNEPWVTKARTRLENDCQRMRQELTARGMLLPRQEDLEAGQRSSPQGPPARPTMWLHEEGVVPLKSPFYIRRPADKELYAAITRRDSIVLIKGPGQVGKTSLLARGLQYAREQGIKVILTDIQRLNAAETESADGLALALANSVADQLDLCTPPHAVWDRQRGANANLDRYLRREAFAEGDAPLVWAIDEVDRLFKHSYCSELFGLFRSWHNERHLDPASPWRRLTLALAYATEAHLFISDIHQPPYNVGIKLALEDFSLDQVQELNHRHQYPLRTSEEICRFYALASGHPYLTTRGLAVLTAQEQTLADLEAASTRDDGPFGNHLRRLLSKLLWDPELTEAARGLLRGAPCPTELSFYRLRSAGLLTGDTREEAYWRYPIYRSYLAQRLLA
jgi:hypothetical protein